jgi:hypothetical protein
MRRKSTLRQYLESLLLSVVKIVGKPLFGWWSIDVARGEHSPIDFTDRLGGMFARFFRDTRWSRTGKVIG